MYQALLGDAKFHQLLLAFDRDLAAGGASRRRPSHTTWHTGHVPRRFDQVELLAYEAGLSGSVIAKTGSAVRPQSVLEVPALLAAPNRSGLRPSFPARPICCSAFRTGVPH